MSGGLTPIRLPKPHAAQQIVIDSKARFKVLMSGRRFGKSLVAQILAIKDLLDGKLVAYLAPSNIYIDGPDGFFMAILNMLPEALIKASNKNNHTIELKTNGIIRFFSGEAIQNFRGKKFHKVIIDEAAFVSDLETAWTESISPTLTDYKGDALFISTPKGRNYFDALYIKGKQKEDGFESFHFTSYDNPYIDPLEIDAQQARLPEAVFKQEYLAIPGEDADNPFGIEYINQNIVEEKDFSTKPTVVFGIDVARTHDWTVVIGLDEDGKMTYFDRFQTPWEMTKKRISSLPDDILKVVDSTGVGAVLLEALQMTVNNIEGFLFTGKSKPEIIYELVKAVEDKTISYNQITADEMAVFVYKYSSTGHLKFEAASGYKDDCVCALAIANHYRKYYQRVTNWQLYTY
jgi:phage FluMu gp28-like protein